MNHKEFHDAMFCPEHAKEMQTLQGRIDALKDLAGELRTGAADYGYPQDTKHFMYQSSFSPREIRMSQHGLGKEEIDYIASMHAARFKESLIRVLTKAILDSGGLI